MRIPAGIRGSNRVQRLSLIAAIGVGALSITGCSAINPQSTTQTISPSDGVMLNMGSLEMRDMLIVSAGQGDPGRLLGAVYNTSDSDISLTISGSGGAQAQLTVKPGSPILLVDAKNKTELSTVSQPAGAMETLTLTQTGPGEQTTTFSVPVLNGIFKEYATLVPTPAPTENLVKLPAPETAATPTPSESAAP